ncbi:hypothetical protein [Paenibacillus sp. Soil787]|nr:hypothetical protein [Paenibacillus sp. Soil787]
MHLLNTFRGRMEKPYSPASQPAPVEALRFSLLQLPEINRPAYEET